MLVKDIVIVNKFGLHTRAAAKLMHLSQRFSSSIKLHLDEKTADAKSIMNLITLGATKDKRLHVIIEGEDETEALHAISELIASRFGEPE